MQTRRGTLYHVPPFRRGAAGKHNNFASSRFFKSPAGILKILVFLLFVAVVGVFFGAQEGQGQSCTGGWVLWVYPIAALLTALGTVLTYTIFMLGWAEEDPDRLVKVDLCATSLLILLDIGVSVGTFLAECTLSGVLMLVGAVLAAVSGGALFILWRYSAEDEEEREDGGGLQLPEDTRVRGLSIHI